MIKVLSWNIRQGGGSRLVKITSNLLTLKPQIIVLSEFRNNHAGLSIRAKLAEGGYRFQAVTAAKPDVNSAAIFSTLPGDIKLFPESDPTYGHNVLAMSFDAFDVYGMYLPHKKKHVLFDFLIAQAQRTQPSIMVGDMNTGKNGIDQKGNSFWYEDKLKSLESHGYTDAFRNIHGDVREYSWYSHQGNGYRYDHSYVSKDLIPVIKDCYYIHEWREQNLSDHSPMIVTIG